MVGSPLNLAQANCSVNIRVVVPGIHFADVPPGQAEYVTCVRGSILDAVVDAGVGSPTYGQWEAAHVDVRNRPAVYLTKGLGHGFVALEDRSTEIYLCSEGDNPGREHTVNALDPAIGVDRTVPSTALELSVKDAAAPLLAGFAAAAVPPTWQECLALRAGQRTNPPSD